MTSSNTFFQPPSEQRDYLLIPVMPTPNGRLHLGHIAGPFLRMDVMARHLRRFGHTVKVISGTDVYESYMLLKSEQTGLPPEEISKRNHALIAADLAALNIQYDDFILPLDEQWSHRYAQRSNALIDTFVAAEKVVMQTERVLYDDDRNHAVVGCWLSGKCPECGTPAGSYFCEECGAHFRPEQIIEPKSYHADAALTEIQVSSAFLKLSSSNRLLEHLQTMNLPAPFMTAASRHIQSQAGHVRLTTPGTWGIPWKIGSGNISNVIFTYTGLASFSLLCGDRYRELSDQAIHPFSPESRVVTIASFGFDNSCPYLVSVQGALMEDPATKPFDHYLANFFLFLENKKFSTSRNHVIWAADIVERAEILPDFVRCFLARINPQFQVKNLDIDAFADYINTMSLTLSKTIGAAFEKAVAEEIPALEGYAASSCIKAIEAQSACFDPATFDLAKGEEVLSSWLSEAEVYLANGMPAYWWLKTFAFLAEPLAPGFAAELWRELGHTGLPTISNFNDVPIRQVNRCVPVFPTTTRDAILRAASLT